jgi:hypothetical protein
MIGGLIYLGYQNYLLQQKLNQLSKRQPSSSQAEPMPTTLSNTPNSSETLNTLLKYIQGKDFYIQSDTKFGTVDKDAMWWVSDDNWTVLVKDVPSISLEDKCL